MEPVTTTFTRTFLNAVKGTNMNDSEIVFKRTEQRKLQNRAKLGNWTKAKKIRLANIPTTTMMEGVGTSQDYIIPYHCLGWIQNTQQEVLFANATHYRVESIGLTLYDLKIFEWTTINGEECFIKNDTLEIEINIDPGDYVAFGNLKTITKIPNKGYSLASPTTFEDCELPKYEYYYNMNYAHLKQITIVPDLNEGQTTTCKTILLHDWRDQNHGKIKLRAGMTFNHGWQNPSQFKHPLTNVTVAGKTTIHGHLMNNANYAFENPTHGDVTTDAGLNVCVMPKFDTPTNTKYLKINNPGSKRTYMHGTKSEDYKLLDVANFNQNYIPATYPDETQGYDKDTNPQILRSGAYCVAN